MPVAEHRCGHARACEHDGGCDADDCSPEEPGCLSARRSFLMFLLFPSVPLAGAD
jgi:hypothetical protein